MAHEQPEPVAILRRSREFVEQQMHLFVGKLLRCRIAGVSEGKPRLNFGSFSIPFENQADFRDGEIATFRIIGLTNNLITLGLVRREGAVMQAAEENIGGKVAALLSELNLPIDDEYSTAVRGLLKAGFAATRENIRAAVALKADPGGEGVASQVLKGLLLRGGDIPAAIYKALRDYIGSIQDDEIVPENAIRNPSPEKLLELAEKLGRVRAQDKVAVEAQVLMRRIISAIKPLSLEEPRDIIETYRSTASGRVGAEAALTRAFNAFIPKFISSLHPNDALRIIFNEFAAAAKGQAAESEPLPIAILQAFMGFIQNDSTLAESIKDLLNAFASYIRQIIGAETASDGKSPMGVEARELQGNASLNLGRLMVVAGKAAGESTPALGSETLDLIRESAQSVLSKSEGIRFAEWLSSPARTGPDNLPVVGFTLPEGQRGSISLYAGVKRRRDKGEETPAGGRLVYEGEGIGKVEIGLEYGDDGLSALFITRRKDTHEDIQVGLPTLSDKLDARGVKVKSLRSVMRIEREEGIIKPARDDLPQKGLDLKA